MKRRIIGICILLALPACAAETIIEFASRAGSPHMITSGEWRGSVGNNGLYYKEYAFRANRKIHDKVKIASTVGWMNEREFMELRSDVIGLAVIGETGRRPILRHR
jgi:hypothetical protein